MAFNKIKPAGAGELVAGLGMNARKNVAEKLSQLLADTYFLQLKTQYYHWNVTGQNFSGLHALFEQQYNLIAPAVDEIAERIRALGFPSPGTYREFSELSSLTEDKSLPANAQTMVRNLQAAHEFLAQQCRTWIADVQRAGDEASADLFIRRTQEHDKAAWMLRSHLQ